MKTLYVFYNRGVEKFGEEYSHMRDYLASKGCEFLVDELPKAMKNPEKAIKGDYYTTLTQRARIVSNEYSNQKGKEKAIDEFLELYAPNVRARFNLVYRKDLDNYLEWGAFTYNTTKTQLIIDAISEKRERDELYQKLEKKK